MEKRPFCSHYITKLFSVAPLVKNCHREKKPLCPGSFPRAAGLFRQRQPLAPLWRGGCFLCRAPVFCGAEPHREKKLLTLCKI